MVAKALNMRLTVDLALAAGEVKKPKQLSAYLSTPKLTAMMRTNDAKTCERKTQRKLALERIS